jgi:NAD(P)H-flavin reductase
VYVDELRNNGAIVHCFSATPTQDSAFRVAPAVDADIVSSFVPDTSQRYAYISGPPAMVANVKKLLRGKVKRIHTDYFSGY